MIKRLPSKRSNGAYNVWELIQAKELEGGNPVYGVRVVFLNQEKTSEKSDRLWRSERRCGTISGLGKPNRLRSKNEFADSYVRVC